MIESSDTFESRCLAARCRSCCRQGLLGILDLGPMPLADGLLSSQELSAAEPRYPLELAFCPDCAMVQIIETVAPEVLFGRDYPYYSSFSDTLLEHSRQNAEALIESRRLGADSFVVEIASNDGYMLKNFVERGIPSLGIDPAPGPAAAARKIGVPTMEAFFGRQLAAELADAGQRADVIIANNVFAHVADTNGFVAGLATLLKDDGVAVIEVPYVRKLVDHCEFDTIYHEHLCYFSATSVHNLVSRHGLTLNHVEMLGIHGGSMRLFLQRHPAEGSAGALLAEEREIGLDRFEYYQSFGQRVRDIRTQLRDVLQQLKGLGCTVAAYGAAAKGAILLNYVGAGKDMIDFVVDRNIHKQGKYLPGVHLPIDDPLRIMREMPDYVLLLPWNLREEILRQCDPYRKSGGRFIIPIPQPQVI